MRKALYVAVLIAVSIGCQPRVLFFNANPSSAQVGPVNVTLNWKLTAGDGYLSSDKPVTPSLLPPRKVNTQGSDTFSVCKTTTFKLEPHYGGERTVTVNVGKPCDAPVPCTNAVLTFTGTCPSAQQPPDYGAAQMVNAGGAPGALKDLVSDADFPVHVLHAGQDIALGAGGGPIFPLPNVPAAGDYQIYIPGQLGLNICQDATSPVGGGQADAPTIHLTVVPTCPAKP